MQIAESGTGMKEAAWEMYTATSIDLLKAEPMHGVMLMKVNIK